MRKDIFNDMESKKPSNKSVEKPNITEKVEKKQLNMV